MPRLGQIAAFSDHSLASAVANQRGREGEQGGVG